MIPGVRGRLLTTGFLRDVLPSMAGVTPPPQVVARGLAEWSRRVEASLGSASSVRAIADVAVVPLLALLGLRVAGRTDGPSIALQVAAGDHVNLMAFVAPWGEPLGRAWRSSVTSAIASDARWCICCNGQTLRIVDARRTWSRDYVEFDLAVLGRELETQTVLWAIAHAGAMAAEPPLLDRAVDLSSRHGLDVCRSLGAGVLDALAGMFTALAHGRRHAAPLLWEQALTVLYRMLFLLFAEARGLVPLWHPLYRDRYSLETIVTTLLEGRGGRGLWRAVQAISRLAHAGCAADELRVTAFNGRLFSPAQSTAFDDTRLDDDVMRRALLALATTPPGRRTERSRIVYRDLDVEQLGAVYEHVLEHEPSAAADGTLAHTRDRRKASGTFYTPRGVTAFLVRQTLEPLVAGRTAAEILRIRVLDPAMGSGAFLVAACRFLAAAAEDALIREGTWHAHDVLAADRAALRREVASRCLFGVDLNPVAVQLARLSLWLATLASDRPLSFLDHHLVAGQSLIGATPQDLLRQPGGRTRRRPERLPLFDDGGLPAALDHAARVMLRVSLEPDDTAQAVRAKERTLEALQSSDAPLARWTRALDLWCSAWFPSGEQFDRRTFLDLLDHALERRSALPAHTARRLLREAHDTATRHRFLHWPLTFPEVFHAADDPDRPAGFDAVIGNPPWDMVRGDSGGEDTRAGRRTDARLLTAFVRQSGVYQADARAHLNLYQLFLERALQLTRPGGRLGFVVPAGLVSDAGSAPLRRHLFDRVDIDDIAGFDNRQAIFPVHRSVRFVLLSGTTGRATSAIRCRFGLTSPDDLESNVRRPLVLTRRLLARLSGDDDLGIPELVSGHDLAIVEKISATTPRAGAAEGWNVEFGRELNASDDRHLFQAAGDARAGRVVVEGKQLDAFRVAVSRSRFALTPEAEAQVHVPRRARLAYRDVASATNRLTLIAAIMPARAVTTHTLFCLRTPLPLARQRVLGALLNSYVANYLIRLRVHTHVTVALVSRLPVPLVRPGDPVSARLDALAEALAAGAAPVEEMEEHAALQAIAARLYGLSEADFVHVLSTFPLVPAGTKEAAMRRFVTLGET